MDNPASLANLYKLGSSDAMQAMFETFRKDHEASTEEIQSPSRFPFAPLALGLSVVCLLVLAAPRASLTPVR